MPLSGHSHITLALVPHPSILLGSRSVKSFENEWERRYVDLVENMPSDNSLQNGCFVSKKLISLTNFLYLESEMDKTIIDYTAYTRLWTNVTFYGSSNAVE